MTHYRLVVVDLIYARLVARHRVLPSAATMVRFSASKA